jgi:glucose-1-phosphate cytidylyltransferase
MMKAVILCGGLGTRLREETEFRPKPMVPVGGMPILWHIMKIYSHYGVKDFVLCLGYKGGMIKQFFLEQELSGKDFTINLKTGKKDILAGNGIEDWNVTLADTGPNTMTGGRVKRIQKYVSDDEFFLTYGDGVANVDIDLLLSQHRMEGKIGTLTGVNMPSRFGMIKTSGSLITAFVEKPMLDDYINGGFFVFKKDVFDYLEDDETCILETEPLSTLAKERQMAMYRHHGFWHCMDTYRDFTELNKIWDSGKVPWKVW